MTCASGGRTVVGTSSTLALAAFPRRRLKPRNGIHTFP